MRKYSILSLLVFLLFAVGISANSVPTRIADNDPTTAVTGESYNRAVAFGTNSQYFWAWGGGSLGSGAYVTELWRYDLVTDTWSKTFATLPTGEKYTYNTSASFGNLLIATSDGVASGCDTHLYNIDTNIWT